MGRKSRRDVSTQAVGTAMATVADRAGEFASRARDGAVPLVDRVLESAGEFSHAAAPVLGSAVETVSGVLDETLVRGGAAFGALRGQRLSQPVRRWPWALGALVAGAAAGAGAALLVRRIHPPDAPNAQEPHELKAVVDQPIGPPSPGESSTAS